MAPPSRLPISAPVPASRCKSFVALAHRGRVDAPADGASAPSPSVRPSLPSCACELDRLLPLGCSCAQILGLLGGGSCCALSVACSLAHWCCSCPGQGRAAHPWWLRRPGSSDFQNTSRHSDCPNSRRPAPHLRYRPQHSPLPRVCLQQFLGLRQHQDPLNWPACSH